MSKHCSNCGTPLLSNGRCPYCHEELEIMDQYYEQGMQLPSQEFQDKAKQQEKEAKQNRKEMAIEKSMEDPDEIAADEALTPGSFSRWQDRLDD